MQLVLWIEVSNLGSHKFLRMPNQFSRRDWLRLMGVVAGAGTLPVSSWAGQLNDDFMLLPTPAQLKNKPGKPISAITCGAGNRGNVYGGFALAYPEQLDIIVVADPIPFRNDKYALKHNIPAGNRF